MVIVEGRPRLLYLVLARACITTSVMTIDHVAWQLP